MATELAFTNPLDNPDASTSDANFSYKKFRELDDPKDIRKFVMKNVGNAVKAVKAVFGLHSSLTGVGFTRMPLGDKSYKVYKNGSNATVDATQLNEKRVSALISESVISYISIHMAGKVSYSAYKPLVDCIVPLSSKLPIPKFYADSADPNSIDQEIPSANSSFVNMLCLKFFRCKGSDFVAMVHPIYFVADCLLRSKFPDELGLNKLAQLRSMVIPKDPTSARRALYILAATDAAHRLLVRETKTISAWARDHKDAVDGWKHLIDEEYDKLDGGSMRKLNEATAMADSILNDLDTPESAASSMGEDI